MSEEELEDIQPKPDWCQTQKVVTPEIIEPPPVYDKEAMHRKVMAVMIGIFLLILAGMLLMQHQVEFAASGGM